MLPRTLLQCDVAQEWKNARQTWGMWGVVHCCEMHILFSIMDRFGFVRKIFWFYWTWIDSDSVRLECHSFLLLHLSRTESPFLGYPDNISTTKQMKKKKKKHVQNHKHVQNRWKYLKKKKEKINKMSFFYLGKTKSPTRTFYQHDSHLFPSEILYILKYLNQKLSK